MGSCAGNPRRTHLFRPDGRFDTERSSDVTAKNWTADELFARERVRREARAELEQLKQHWPILRETLRPEAIMVMWFLYGGNIFDYKGANDDQTKA